MFNPPPLPRNLEAAFRDLESKTANIRAGAARDVVRHALADSTLRMRAIRALEPALEDPAPLVRAAAALGLGELEATEALPKLLLCVEDENDNVRQMALTAIGELGDARALPRLRRSVSDPRPEVRYQAVIAIGRLAEPAEAAEALAAATHDADVSVGYIALRIGEERFLENKASGTDAADVSAFEPLLARAREIVEAPASTVRLLSRLVAPSVILLARAGDRSESARAQLLRLVRGELACDKEDEQEGVELAGELHLVEAVPDLERRAYGVQRLVKDTCKFHATIALARLGHERTLEDIRRDLAGRRGDRRTAAVVAAGRARLHDLRSTIAAFSDKDVDSRLRDEALFLLDEDAKAR